MTRTVSVVCGVMDRMEPLARSLFTWLDHPEVTEVVLVDWSSTEPLPYCTRDLRVRVVRVEDQQYWHASKCHNLGLRMARGDLVLRLDADDMLMSHPDEVGPTDFFEAHDHTFDNSFFCLDQTMLRESDEVHLAGVVYARRKDLLGVGGYNERLRTYGNEDDDLVARLKVSGARALPLDTTTLYHLSHSDDDRVARIPIREFPELTVKPRDACWTWNLGVVARSIEVSKREASQRPWTSADQMATFKIVQRGNHLEAREVLGEELEKHTPNDKSQIKV